MKGITNMEIREKFEHIEAELEHIKNVGDTIDFSFLIIAAIFSITATCFYAFYPTPLITFFMIAGILSMVFLVIKHYFTVNKK